MTRRARKDPLVWGVILIFIGLIFLLERFEIRIWDAVARLWPVILIVWGAWKLALGIKERNADTKPVPPSGMNEPHENP